MRELVFYCEIKDVYNHGVHGSTFEEWRKNYRKIPASRMTEEESNFYGVSNETIMYEYMDAE